MSTGATTISQAQTVSLLAVLLCGVILASDPVRAGQSSPPRVAADGTEWTLSRLTGLFTQVPVRRAYFVETYHSTLFTQPIKTEGELTFTAPSKVEKRVLKPFEERYLADGDTLVVENRAEGTTRRLSLDEHPALRAFVEGFRAVLAGDWERLQQFYKVQLEGMQSRWVLSLHPLDQDMRERVSFIRYRGRDDVITSIEIRESNGDHSVMVMTRQGL